MKITLLAFGSAVLLVGCATDERVGRLEKRVEELNVEQKKNQAVVDFDLQGKCAKDSRTWFNENWSRDKDTALLTYTNHYNKTKNKCFVFVEYHYNFGPSGSWINDMTLWNIYENEKYGDFSQSTTVFLKPKYESTKSVASCEVYGKRCTTVEEFNNLVSPYLNE
jgi:hypothetical protein